VRLYFDGAERDISGALSAQIYVQEDVGTWLWLQRDRVAAGEVRVSPNAAHREGVVSLLEFEESARFAREGIWAYPVFAVRQADAKALSAEIGAFVIVEGKVVLAGSVAHRVFLNFGDDCKTDFTVAIPG